MFLSVIIPVYNEAGVINQNIRRVIDYLKNKTFVWEIIVVDDGSTDESRKIISGFEEVVLVFHQKNQGKGAAVKRGMLAAQGEWLLFLDADLSTDITEFDKFIPWLTKFDIIIGNRQHQQTKIIKSQPFYRVFLGRFGNLLIRNLLGFTCKDTQCGFKIFNKQCKIIFEKQTLPGWGFDFEILYLAKRYNFKTKEIGVNWQDSNHTNIKFTSYFKTLKELLKIKSNILRKIYD